VAQPHKERSPSGSRLISAQLRFTFLKFSNITGEGLNSALQTFNFFKRIASQTNALTEP
jgi:hypothetical protein